MARSIKFNGTTVAPGQELRIDLQIARLPTHTNIDLPVLVRRGLNPGPVLLLTAGLHGDELNGIEILRTMIQDKLLHPVAGTIVAIPIVNIYGFLQNARYLPDGKDLNRSFPGSNTGSLARRVAHVLMKDIIPQIDYGIDFHTGGANITNYPQIRMVFDNKDNEFLADAFAAPFTLNSPLIDKSFRKAAASKGKSIIVYEGGESQRFDKDAIQEGIDGALRVMQKLGMIEQAPQVYHERIRLDESAWLRARYSGIFHYFINPGDFIKRNQVIGTITDPYGESEFKVKAKHSGYVIGLNQTPVINAGDALMHVGVKG